MADAMNEIKCIKSHFGFYPEHYFTEALASDLKALGLDGEALKRQRKALETDLIELADSPIGYAGNVESRAKIIDSIFESLGFYKAEQDNATLKATNLNLNIKNRDYTLALTKRFELKGQGELWLISHNQDYVSSSLPNDAELLEAMTAEYFFDSPCLLKAKAETVWFTWKECLDSLFDLDSPYCEWLMINSGTKLFLFERGKWQEEQAYLELDILQLFGLNSDDYYKMAESLFSPKAFPIESAEFFHEKLSHNAHKKAAEVTKSLRDTVRESIELIANEVLNYHEKTPLEALKKYDFKQESDRSAAAEALFDQCLRYVYRILFLLFTESQEQSKGALPVNSRPYQRGYAIERIRDLEGLISLSNQDPQSQGQFIQKTLERVFKVYFSGYHNGSIQSESEKSTDALGFAFPALGTWTRRTRTRPFSSFQRRQVYHQQHFQCGQA